MKNKIENIANKYGFERVYAVKADTLDLWYKNAGEYRDKLVYDIKNRYPYALSVLLLVYPYKPYSIDEEILSYYINSNKSYHLVKEVVKKISAFGRAELAEIPARALCLKNGIGDAQKNGLLNLKGFGSRFVLYTVVNDFIEPEEYFEPGESCGGCRKCEKACPMNAIAGGFDRHKCIRYSMETAMHPDFVKEKLMHFLGCEICQSVCPHNKNIEITEPDEQIKKAFDMQRLINGDCSDARKLVGKNITSNGKLTAEAIVISANKGEIILPEKKEQFEAVQDAIRFVKS